MALYHQTKIWVNEHPAKIADVHRTIREITSSLASYYEITYHTSSPYYSGHESTDDREETGQYTLMKNGVPKGSFVVHNNQRSLPSPTNDFPLGIADVTIAVIFKLEDQENKHLADDLARLFGKLEQTLTFP